MKIISHAYHKLLSFLRPAIPEKKLVVVIASYNNKSWYKKNLDSIFDQQYSNYRVIYIDDCSPDNTGNMVEAYLNEKGQSDRVTLIKNPINRGATANRYTGSHLCQDDEILLILDGDDWFAHNNVMNVINRAYANENTWMTYGQYQRYPTKEKGHCKKLPDSFDHRASTCFYTSHLRTYYAKLFKKIPKQHFIYKDDFYSIAGDVAEKLSCQLQLNIQNDSLIQLSRCSS